MSGLPPLTPQLIAQMEAMGISKSQIAEFQRLEGKVDSGTPLTAGQQAKVAALLQIFINVALSVPLNFSGGPDVYSQVDNFLAETSSKFANIITSYSGQLTLNATIVTSFSQGKVTWLPVRPTMRALMKELMGVQINPKKMSSPQLKL